jgi:hypothetical protein
MATEDREEFLLTGETQGLCSVWVDVVVVFHISPPPCRPQLACTAAHGSWPGRIVYLFQLSECIILLFDVHVQERRW